MMKKIFIIFFLCVCSAFFLFARSSESGTIEKMVDMSLEGLKDSYQKLSDQNRLLSSEIEGYRKHIQSLRQELDSLASQRTELSAMPGGQGKAGVMSPEASDYQEIRRLKDGINSNSKEAIEGAFQQKKGELDTALEQSRKKLRAARLDVKTMREQNTGGAVIARLKARRAQLQQQLVDRQAGVKLESAKTYANRLGKEISKLKTRQKELERKLSRSSSEEPIDADQFTEESFQLRKRFVALYDENIRLKKEVFGFGATAVSP
ncbi:MAG TPA: hypothetical protein DE315_05040 [Candidatus Omnitrophica bacterium]|nr:MAG: hypothetical protein A2Y05_02450 [Omnitrophica WOR_2 bacterium GWA2_53_43]HCI44878.1 hypothetical protein [Candidatus Omnitrophota bacterium]